MERSLFGFIIRYSKREQLMILPLVIASMLIYFSMLDLPKAIINEAIQGKRFPEAASTVAFLKIHLTLPRSSAAARCSCSTASRCTSCPTWSRSRSPSSP
jgi:hypothetical protein